jgi:hypothetical protein
VSRCVRELGCGRRHPIRQAACGLIPFGIVILHILAFSSDIHPNANILSSKYAKVYSHACLCRVAPRDYQLDSASSVCFNAGGFSWLLNTGTVHNTLFNRTIVTEAHQVSIPQATYILNFNAASYSQLTDILHNHRVSRVALQCIVTPRPSCLGSTMGGTSPRLRLPPLKDEAGMKALQRVALSYRSPFLVVIQYGVPAYISS